MTLPTNNDEQDYKSTLQMNLFGLLDVDGRDIEQGTIYSNALQAVELMPRFYRGKGSQITEVKRLELGLAHKDMTISNQYRLREKVDGKWVEESFTCHIGPAAIFKIANNSLSNQPENHFCYPSDREELIEKVLILLAIKNGLTKTNVGGIDRYGFGFTLYEIYTELKNLNKTKSYSQIHEALVIIRDSKIRITNAQGIQKTNSIFPDMCLDVDGKGKARDRCFVSMSDFVILEIEQLNYRQILFSRITKLKMSLSRYLDLYLSNYFRHADNDNSYMLSTKDVFESYGKKQLSHEQKRRDMRGALKELVESGIIRSVSSAKKLTRTNGEFDWIFEVQPTESFVDECIIANRKNKQRQSLAASIENKEITRLPEQHSLALF